MVWLAGSMRKCYKTPLSVKRTAAHMEVSIMRCARSAAQVSSAQLQGARHEQCGSCDVVPAPAQLAGVGQRLPVHLQPGDHALCQRVKLQLKIYITARV
jgi:hypothetical protein